VSVWQSSMIGLARSSAMRRLMQGTQLTQQLAGRFVGGQDASAAVARAIQLKRRGLSASLYYLGEYVTDEHRIEGNVAELNAAVQGLAATDLGVHVSVDPTQVGYARSAALGERNMQRLAELVAGVPGQRQRVLMLDMEDFSYVQPTLDLHARLLQANLPAAITIQAYLHRSAADIDRLIGQGATVRLVKGAFAETKERSWTDRTAISRAYLRLAAKLISAAAQDRGVYPIFATHDEKLIRAIEGMLQAASRPAGTYEFELLYGVRPALQDRLVEDGHAVRLYLPFGTEWWPYAARRVGENPANALFVARALPAALRR